MQQLDSIINLLGEIRTLLNTKQLTVPIHTYTLSVASDNTMVTVTRDDGAAVSLTPTDFGGDS